jgi:hypothetical protein
MSEPDAVPLPREGEVFFDVRGDSRTMRLSWYADSSVAVFSIWQGNRCTGTFRLPFADLVRMVETLQAGPPSREADRTSRHGGQPSYANAGYGQTVTYADAPGYGGGPPYGTGSGYGYGSDYGRPHDGGAGRGGDQHYSREYQAAGGGQGYGPPEHYGAPDGYGAPPGYGGQAPYGQADYDGGEAPRYVPDVAPQTGHHHAAADYVRESHGYADSRGYAEPPGYAESHGHGEAPGYAETPGYGESPAYSQSAGYGGPARHAEPTRYGQHHEYRGEYSGAYRGETQFLAAPPATSAPYQDEAQAGAWRDDRTEPQGEPGLPGYPAGPAKTEQAAPDWGQATASYRGR